MPPDEHFQTMWRKRVANGAAPGLSGFTGDHGLPLIEDHECLRGLAAMIQLIRNGQLGYDTRAFLFDNPLVAVPKPNGTERPIVMQETLYKMAAIHALLELAPDAVEILGEDQFALLTGGAGSAGLSTKAALEADTGVSTDLGNAFNTVDRAVMLRRLYDELRLSPVFRLVDWAYSRPTQLCVAGPDGELHFMSSTNGTRQGDPLSLLLFCIAIKSEIEAAKAAGGENVRCVADVDDVTFLGTGQDNGIGVCRALRVFKQGVEENLHMRFQSSKSAIIVFNDRPIPDEVLQCSTDLGIRLERGAIILVGIPMGSDLARVQQLALQMAKQSDKFFASVTSEIMSFAVADRLLRTCGVVRANYLARSGLLGEYDLAFEHFDANTEHVASVLLGGNTDVDLRGGTAQLEAPMRNGGFAYRRYTGSISLYGSFAAFAAAAHHIRRVCPYGLPPRFATSVVHTNTALHGLVDEETVQLLPLAGSNADTCLDWFCSDEGAGGAVKLQRTLTHSADDASFERGLAQASPLDRARLLAVTAPYASSWLCDPALMDDDAHAAACRLRRGQPLSDLYPRSCHCGADLQNDPWHVISHAGGHLRVSRHDTIRDLIAEWAKKAGARAWIEPRQDHWHDNRRPDIRIVLGAKVYQLDVSIPHPTGEAHLRDAGRGQLAVAEVVAAAKSQRYSPMCRAEARAPPSSPSSSRRTVGSAKLPETS